MIKAIYGKDKILMFRLLSEAKEKEAVKLALQTSHTITYERDSEQTQTKDGAINTSKGLTVTVDIEAVSSRDEVNTMLKNSVLEGQKLECWEIDLSEPTPDGKYPALYMQGDLDSWELPADVEELASFSTTLNVDGKPQAGEVTLSSDQEDEIMYAFRDITIFDGEEPAVDPGA